MSILSNLVRKISAPVATVASFVPTPAGQAVAFTASRIAQDTARRDAKRAQERERNQLMEFFGSGSSIPTIQQNLARTTPVLGTQSSGGGFFDTVRSGLREVGGFVSDAFSSGIPQLLGISRPPGVAQQPAHNRNKYRCTRKSRFRLDPSWSWYTLAIHSVWST